MKYNSAYFYSKGKNVEESTDIVAPSVAANSRLTRVQCPFLPPRLCYGAI